MLPFSREQFVGLFVQYNINVWPIQILAYVLGLAMVASLWRRSRAADCFIAGGLAAMWLWTGIAYQWMHFSTINSAGFGFAFLFVLQGILLIVAAARDAVHFRVTDKPSAWVGLALVFYALILYPLLGRLGDQVFPAMPVFGIAPCPVVIFTFGMLLTANGSGWLLVMPVVWSLIGGSAAFLLQMPQDWLLLFSGLAVPIILLLRLRASRTYNVHHVNGSQLPSL